MNTLTSRRTPVRATRQLHSTAQRFDSTQTSSSPNNGTASEPEAAGTPQSKSQSGQGEGSQENADTAGNYFAELSPEAIDALAAELSAETAQHTTLLSEVVPEENGQGNKAPQAASRRTKVESNGLTIHYTSPRAPKTHSKSPKESKSTGEGAAESTNKDGWNPPPREHWQIDKQALKEKFPEGWNPRRRLSPDALAGIRALHAQMPQEFTTSALAARFEVSPEAIRRILRSKWSPNSDEETDRERRWFNRGKQIYEKHAESGQKPPKRWRELGIKMKRRKKKTGLKVKAPLPALVTTAKRPIRTTFNQKMGNGLSDRML
jgi:hypothetical protein